jgi:hypothetical protein
MRGTRTVARIALLRWAGMTERQKVADSELSDADHQPSNDLITDRALTRDRRWPRRLKFSRAPGRPSRGRRISGSTSHASQSTSRRLRCIQRRVDDAEVHAAPSTLTCHSEAHRIQPKTSNWLPRTSTPVGPWLGGSKRTPNRESARSPPDHRGNRATRSARLPSGPRSPSKPAKESSTCPIEVHQRPEGKAVTGIRAALPWSPYYRWPAAAPWPTASWPPTRSARSSSC